MNTIRAITTFVLIFSLPLPSFAADIPHVLAKMKKASFWIARDPKNEEVILDRAGIERLNLAVYHQYDFISRLEDIEEELTGEEVKTLIGDPELPPKKSYYSPKGKLYTEKFYRELEDNINLGGIPEKVKVVFGLTVTRTNIRTHPTNAPALKKPDETYFDRFQDTSLEPAQFAAKIHSSKDGQFVYVIAAYDRGWVAEKDIAWAGSRKEMQEYFKAPKTAVNLAKDTRVYLDAKRKETWNSIHMGTALPLLKHEPEQPWTVKIPARGDKGELIIKEGNIPAQADVREGYLPYSGANIIRQAFKLLGDPYDWGGKRGRRDCSQFIMEVFAACGINLPRNSFYQGEAAAELFSQSSENYFPSREEILKSARPGLTLLQMPRHIMLYLGEYQDRFYVIHDLWAYPRPGKKKRPLEVAKVIVSDLSLGEQSEAGSLLQRITRISEVNHDYPWEEDDGSKVQEGVGAIHELPLHEGTFWIKP